MQKGKSNFFEAEDVCKIPSRFRLWSLFTGGVKLPVITVVIRRLFYNFNSSKVEISY